MLFNKLPIYICMHCVVPKQLKQLCSSKKLFILDPHKRNSLLRPPTPLEIYSKIHKAPSKFQSHLWGKDEYPLELHTTNLCYFINHLYARIADLYFLVVNPSQQGMLLDKGILMSSNSQWKCANSVQAIYTCRWF